MRRVPLSGAAAVLLLDALPSPLCIPLLASESQQALSLVLSLIHQELLREQQGSGAVLTALSQVLLAMGLRAHASDPHGALGLVGALQDPRLGARCRPCWPIRLTLERG